MSIKLNHAHFDILIAILYSLKLLFKKQPKTKISLNQRDHQTLRTYSILVLL